MRQKNNLCEKQKKNGVLLMKFKNKKNSKKYEAIQVYQKEKPISQALFGTILKKQKEIEKCKKKSLRESELLGDLSLKSELLSQEKN